MKKLVAVLVLMAWASLAHGQTVGQDGQSTRQVQQGMLQAGILSADSTIKVLRMSSSGSAMISDESRDRDYINLFTAITNASLAAGVADSNTTPMSVGAYRYLKLLVKAVPIGATVNTTCRLAFQFRECANAATDSNSVFSEYLYGAVPTVVDTSSFGHLSTGGISTAWSGEYVLTVNANRNAAAATTGAYGAFPNGLSIPFDSFYGRPVHFDKLQVRVRNLNITGPAVKLNVYVKAFAQ